MEEIIFYKEWLGVSKMEFRILAMLADAGTFQGNLSDICRYFQITSQTKIRQAIENDIRSLEEKDFLIRKWKSERIFELSIIPQKNEIKIDRENYYFVRNHNYQEEVSWQVVLKVYFWIVSHYLECVNKSEKELETTLWEIAVDIASSKDQVSNAIRVLENECSCIRRKINRVWDPDKGKWYCSGQTIIPSAFWNKKNYFSP